MAQRIVGAGTIVRDYCQIGGHTTMGARGVYGHGAEFDGVALDTVYCYHYCEIWGVVGEAVDFGAATVCGNLRFDDGKTAWRIKGRAETPAHAANAAYFGDIPHGRQRHHHARSPHWCLWRGRGGRGRL